MYVLQNVVQSYEWGSRRAIAELLGRPFPTEKPEAELWMGAHPAAPSRVLGGAATVPLSEAVASDPTGWLGASTVARFGPALPFLFKVLAAECPLSLQAHPDADQARQGFAAEEATGVPRDAPYRNYKDPGAKPEVLCALGPFEALLGFRDANDTRRLFDALGVAELAPYADDLSDGAGPPGIARAFHRLMRVPLATRGALVSATAASCQRLAERATEFTTECRWAVRLAARYPDDVGVIVALMMNVIELSAGEAIYVPAGKLHAYLHGVGVELMASSDNVLRGGLTGKHVDPGELARVLRFDDEAPHPVPCRVESGELVYVTPASEFRLSRIALAGEERWRAARRLGPEILLCVEGEVEVRAEDGARISARKGSSLFITPRSGAYEIAGPGVLFRATVGESTAV